MKKGNIDFYEFHHFRCFIDLDVSGCPEFDFINIGSLFVFLSVLLFLLELWDKNSDFILISFLIFH